MSEQAAFDAIRLIYQLSELIWYGMPDGITKTRLDNLREEIREKYDESVWK